jgi:hypothetical protein
MGIITILRQMFVGASFSAGETERFASDTGHVAAKVGIAHAAPLHLVLYLEFSNYASEARRVWHGDVVVNCVDQSDSRFSKQDRGASLLATTHSDVLLVTAVMLAPWKKFTLVNS